MGTLKYKVIKNKTQYKEYCHVLETLADSDSKSKTLRDEVDLLTLLIENWDDEHSMLLSSDPIQLLRALMADHQMKAIDLVRVLKVSKGYVSDILNYRKVLSKHVIRDLSSNFKVFQEAFNRPCKLNSPVCTGVRKARSSSKVRQADIPR